MTTTHVCLVSRQLLPNLIPALMMKPDCVHLIVSGDMKNEARRLARLLKGAGIQVERHDDAPSTGVSELAGYAGQLAMKLGVGGNGQLVLNATGGTKPMALAFVQEMRALVDDVQIIYTDTEQGRVEFLHPREEPAIRQRHVVDLDTYLNAYGQTRRRAESDDELWLERAEELKPIVRKLALEAGADKGFLGALNKAAEATCWGDDDKSFRNLQPLEAYGHRAKALLDAIADDGLNLLSIVSAKTVRFHSPGAARFLNGAWLEQYAWWRLRERGVLDAQCGVEVGWQERSAGRGANNEYDVLAVNANRLLMIECKTGNLRGKGANQDILNKLESLGRNTGGLFGKAVLLSARPLGDDVRARAKSYQLELFDCTELKAFDQFIESWIRHDPESVA